MLAASKSKEELLMVKSTALPPGSTCGHRCVASPAVESSLVSSAGVPPASDTLKSPDLVVGEKTMFPSSPQSPPFGPSASQSVRAAPPVIEIFFSLLPAKKAIHCPSGEKKGLEAFSVPANAVAWLWSRRRTKSWVGPPLLGRAANTNTVPFLERAAAGPEVESRVASAPNSTLKHRGDAGRGASHVLTQSSVPTRARARTTATPHGSARRQAGG